MLRRHKMALLYTEEQIRDALKDKNQAEVARRIGIHPMTISLIMNGKTKMSFSTYRKLSSYLFPEGEK